MRKLALVIGACTLAFSFAAEAAPKNVKEGPALKALDTSDVGDAEPMGKIGKSCRYKGKKLWGKVKVVKSFPDFKVKVVSSFPDLKVKKVSSFPDKCGKWKFVKSFPNFKIKYVRSFPDFKIKFVRSFPGVK